jgi:hypothetical protein
MFELGKGPFNAISVSIEPLMVEPLRFAVASRRDDGLRSVGSNLLQNCIRVIAFVGDDILAPTSTEESGCLGRFVYLSARQPEVYGLAPLVTQQMNLSGQSSAGTPQSLVGAPFLRPVAAC